MFRKIIFILFVLISFSLAADIFNVGTVYNGNAQVVPTTGDIVAYWETEDQVTVKFRFTFVDSSDAYHSKPVYIGDCNVAYSYATAIQSATGDANIIWHYSSDDRNTWWAVVTPSGLDAVSSTAKTDTLGINGGVVSTAHKVSQWLVIESVGGGSSNHDGNIFTIVLAFEKDVLGSTFKGQRVASKSGTSP